MSKKTDQIKFMQAMFPNAKFVECKYIEEGYELNNEENFNISEENVKSDNISLTEQWKRGELAEGEYYIKSNKGDIYIDVCADGSFMFTNYRSVEEVLAEVPDYDNWQILNELLENSLQNSKTLSHILRLSFDPYFKGLKPEDIFELAKKSIRLTKQSCEDNTTIQRLKELLEYCADILEELDDKDRDIEILLEEIDEVLK